VALICDLLKMQLAFKKNVNVNCECILKNKEEFHEYERKRQKEYSPTAEGMVG